MAAGATLAVSTSGASAAVDRTVYRCEGTGTWTISIDLFGASTATRTISSSAGGCKKIHAGLGDDGNFIVRSFDASEFDGARTLDLIGVGVTGVRAFVGVTRPQTTVQPPLRGPIAIAGDSLDATLTSADATPVTASEIHTGDGSCGTNCYRTKVVWVVTRSGVQ